MSPNEKMSAAASEADDIGGAVLRVGTTLHGKYNLDKVLGVGGMAVVYAATHRNGKRFAIKLLHPEYSSRRDIRARFLREGYVANAVNHPGVVGVLDDDVTDDGSAFLVMELLDGSTVDALGARPGSRMPLREVLGIAYQLLDVLDAAHTKKIVHRDIKPANLFVLRDGTVKVLDFGLARLRDATLSLNLTQTGQTMGTPAFMPPEQALGDVNNINPRTDIWAVGATLFTALSGHLVHEGTTGQQVMVRAATTPARSLSSVFPDAPPSVVALISKALEFDRSARWSSAAVMRDAVARAHGELFGTVQLGHLKSLFDNEAVNIQSAPTELHPNDVSIRTIGESAVVSASVSVTSSNDSASSTLAGPGTSQPESRLPGSKRALVIMAVGLVTLLSSSALILWSTKRESHHIADISLMNSPTPVAPTLGAAPIPPRIKGQNPFTGVRLYVNAYSAVAAQAMQWKSDRLQDAKLLQRIAAQPVGLWMGAQSGDIESAVRDIGTSTNGANVVPVVVIYNIPNRDCGQYGKGGSITTQAYRTWIRAFAQGAGMSRMIIVLEPDAIPMLTGCLSLADQKERMSTVRDAIEVLEAKPGLSVYLDAGHPNWGIPADEMAKRLGAAGIEAADGFSLNVGNFITTDANIRYGRAISAALGGKHFIIDTSRNGNGPTFEGAWCNPKGRALGSPPTTNTGDPLVDAYFWVKPPGESDGDCNGGPKLGVFWPEQALDLARRAKWTTSQAQSIGSVEAP